jgi:GT2 family glycosyltransferase
MKLSVIVPCYNEAKNIPLILDKFTSIIKRPDIEILFVNNGSKDTSQEVFNQMVPKYSFAKVIKIEVNQGYGFGITHLRACPGKPRLMFTAGWAPRQSSMVTSMMWRAPSFQF